MAGCPYYAIALLFVNPAITRKFRPPDRTLGSMRTFGVLWLACSAGLAAQDLFPRNYISGGVGIGMPRGEINQIFDTRAGLTINYGYRFHRYLQADLAYDVVFGSARINDIIQTQLGPQRIRDRQHIIPFGGRGIIPLARGRVLLSGGGGLAYLRYQESISQPNVNFRLTCPACLGRGGWGGYGLVNAKFTNRWQRIWFGVTTKVIRGRTEGEPFAGLPTARTKDHWITTFAEIGFGF